MNENRALPNVFAVSQGAAFSMNSNDPLGVLDAQGMHIVVNNDTDLLRVLSEPALVLPPSRATVDSDRMRAKMVNAFTLNYSANEKKLEQSRADNLVRL
jgi:hypothetical protein